MKKIYKKLRRKVVEKYLNIKKNLLTIYINLRLEVIFDDDAILKVINLILFLAKLVSVNNLTVNLYKMFFGKKINTEYYKENL